jgi:competence protein ComEC
MIHWLTRQIHSVYLIAGLATGVLIGCLAAYFEPSTWFTAWSWWLVWLFWILVCFWKARRWSVIILICIGVMIGYGRGATEIASWVDLGSVTNTETLLSGVVREDPEPGSGSEVRLRLDSVTLNNASYGGVYWVTVAGADAELIQRSDRVIVRGDIQSGFGTFAATMFRAQLVELQKQARFDPLLEVRNVFAGAIRSTMPDPEAALGIGYILGQKRALPPEFEEALLVVGLTHVVVASGYNLTILVRLSRRLFEKISRYMAVMFSGGLIVAFIGVTGMSPSMSRAGLVAGLSLVAWYYGRTIHPAVLLVVTAAISVLVQPSYLWGDVGWMLSFASFAGVMFLAPLLQAYFYGEQKPGVIRQVLGETFSAQLVTLPIVLLAFGVISNVALLANVLVLPLVPLAMLLTFVAGVAGIVMPALAGFVALPAYWLLSYMTWVIELLANLPWASAKIQIDLLMVIAMYGALCLLVIYLRRRTGFSFRRVNLVE